MDPFTGYKITVTKADSQTVVFVDWGGGYNANSQGVVRFTK